MTKTNLKLVTILGITSMALYASPAFAQEAPEAEVTETAVENTQVLAAVETADLIPVQDEDGQIYYNHYVSDDELFDATIDHETVGTYEVEYNGRVYINKIVTE